MLESKILLNSRPNDLLYLFNLVSGLMWDYIVAYAVSPLDMFQSYALMLINKGSAQ
jgi:hypothetical protein